MYFYDLDTEEMKKVLNSSPYNPYSSEKKNRKLTTLINYLNNSGYEVGKSGIEVHKERGFFGTDIIVRIYNPHYGQNSDDDNIYYNLHWFTF